MPPGHAAVPGLQGHGVLPAPPGPTAAFSPGHGAAPPPPPPRPKAVGRPAGPSAPPTPPPVHVLMTRATKEGEVVSKEVDLMKMVAPPPSLRVRPAGVETCAGGQTLHCPAGQQGGQDSLHGSGHGMLATSLPGQTFESPGFVSRYTGWDQSNRTPKLQGNDRLGSVIVGVSVGYHRGSTGQSPTHGSHSDWADRGGAPRADGGGLAPSADHDRRSRSRKRRSGHDSRARSKKRHWHSRRRGGSRSDSRSPSRSRKRTTSSSRSSSRRRRRRRRHRDRERGERPYQESTKGGQPPQ